MANSTACAPAVSWSTGWIPPPARSAIEVVKPLWSLRVIVEEHDGIAADLTLEGRAFPIEEPRFIRRVGTRAFMDYTRLTQNCTWKGWVSIDGKRIELSPKAIGTRDRSWGIRPIGMSDPQPNPLAGEQGYFWQWTPLNFADKSLYFHIAAEPSGAVWNTRSVLVPNGAMPEQFLECEKPVMETTLEPGTLWPDAWQADGGLWHRALHARPSSRSSASR